MQIDYPSLLVGKALTKEGTKVLQGKKHSADIQSELLVLYL
jgi:hypothetical protein